MNNQLEVVYEVLRGRGITDKEEIASFLNPRYEATHNPLELAGMDKAVARIKRAIDEEERIVVYGDYDIDGLSATTLLLDALGAMGADVSAYIPDRFEEGYGINTEALQRLKQEGAHLVITVDCGSTSFEPLEWASDNQLDIVVTDHHTVADELPPAVALINPKRTDNQYPFTDLAGVGVAFKLVQGLQQVGLLPEGREKWLLDLVALGTVCDVVSLTGENRILVTYGLEVFKRTPRLGLQALMKVAGVNKQTIDTHHFGFMLGPRLNAAGRLEHARQALKLLTAQDKQTALETARMLDSLNYQRREEQASILTAAQRQAETFKQDDVLVLSGADWNHGIVGIVAAKIMEQYMKPAVILQELGSEAKGSARSFGEFSIVEAMRASDDLLIKYGGHHVAAGCTLKSSDIDAFRRRLNGYFRDKKHRNLQAELQADIRLDSLEPVDDELLSVFKQLAPFGMGNPPPLLHLSGIDPSTFRLVGNDKRHLKARLEDRSGRTLDGIGFGLADRLENVGSRVDVWFELAENEYLGRRSLQALIKDIR